MIFGLLFLMALSLLQVPLSDGQGCLSKRSVLATIRQMQKLLSTQEAAQLQGLRSLRKQLTMLQGNVHKQATRRNGIDDCASHPCTNGGTCVDDVQRYICLCPSGWIGSNCQTPATSYWVSLSNSSFSRQPRCAENGQGARQCSCDTGFQMRAGGLCQDVDECQLFQLNQQNRICVHSCINLPGSYRCVCPAGYLLNPDQNTCEDVDECADQQHNCSRGELCINVFGGFQCVRPECPRPRHNTSYVKTSAFQCERNPCPVDSQACRQAANSISFHYLPLPSNRTVPRVLFRMSTTRFLGDSLRFAITGGRGLGAFAVQRSDRHTGELVLTSPVPGPATLEVQLEMSELSKKVLLGKHVFRITAFISPYEF
ncbi:fibulin-7-like [Gracilinanus agilis]|uniref:fibulin-7-like n=1 Tax=Gracilinanus agilis TaxID=191870 RepID=UPI001CFC70D9|nr:fibulin-7-like [Gracilinanus agilis]